MTIGEKIRKARMAKGYTQEKLGELLGVQKAAVGKWENGKVVNIKRSILKQIADVLEIRPSELIFETDPEPTVDLHARILKDDDLMDMIEDYYKLDKEKQSIVRALIKNMVGAE